MVFCLSVMINWCVIVSLLAERRQHYTQFYEEAVVCIDRRRLRNTTSLLELPKQNWPLVRKVAGSNPILLRQLEQRGCVTEPPPIDTHDSLLIELRIVLTTLGEQLYYHAPVYHDGQTEHHRMLIRGRQSKDIGSRNPRMGFRNTAYSGTTGTGSAI
jgi:hypothetical protein